MKNAKCALAIFVGFVSFQSARSDVTLTLRDGQSQPIQGVSCYQNGGLPVLSDATGKLTLGDVTSVFKPQQRSDGRRLFTQIPLEAGEKAALTVTNIHGQKILRGEISL